jgi:integrase
MVVNQHMGVRAKMHKGSWWVFVNHHGMRRAKKVGDRTTAHEVARAIRRKLLDGDLGVLQARDTETLGAVAQRWMNSVEGALKPATLRFYRLHLDHHVLPALGKKPVAAINRADCRALIAACRSKGAGRATAVGALRTLSAALSLAVDDGLIQANPTFRMGKHVRTATDAPRVIEAFTVDEARRILEVADRDGALASGMLTTALMTGMRLGELLGLQWGDLDFNSHFIEVRRTRTGAVLGSPKNRQSRRIDMAEAVKNSLRRLRAQCQREALAAGRTLPDFVFLGQRGTPIDGDNFRKRVFYRLLDRAGIRRLGPHSLRHTYATLMIRQGESLAYISAQMGHSSIQVTVDRYGHLVPGDNRRAVERLGAFLTEERGDSASRSDHAGIGA